ncbi:MAG: TIGR03545 family protein, partial [Planctomycetaceae bacterium]
MIRWSYVLPRLVAMVAILLFVTYGLSPLAHRITVATLQSLTGARVDLEHVEVGLFPPRLLYHQLALANPSGDKAMSNIASAEKVELQIDGGELLRRRYVVSEARITGLRFDSDRLTA